MRIRKSSNGLTVNAIAGSYVVLLGLDIAAALRKGLRGFAVKREDHNEQESYWMSGTKVFESLVPHPAPGQQVTCLEHPYQTFQWADYSAKPGYTYTYTVVAMYGKPGALEQRQAVSVTVETEPVEGALHTIHFNRGSTASQEYARRFQNVPPEKAGPAARQWLSRGLVEGIIAFIRRAKGKGWGLKGAYYEFQSPEILDELRAAKQRGAEVKIVFDDISDEPGSKNEEAVAASKITRLAKPRHNGKLMHNKFVVLLQGGKPVAVLFGSTNLTPNGLYGHANSTHVVENAKIAAAYLAYQEKLATDPETGRGSTYKGWTVEQTPAPATDYIEDMAPVFSPRNSIEALEWYADIAAKTKKGLFMTFAFGMGKEFQAVYGKEDDVLRFGLMEKEWNGANKEAQVAALRKLQARQNVVIAVGNHIPLNGFDQWLGEQDRGSNLHVKWIHLKFLLSDPLSAKPTVVTGSANFSKASTDTNDENMLVIRNDTRVADIYLGEYMRLYSHYAFRQAVRIFLTKNPKAKPEDMKQGFLIEDGDWTKPYFDKKDASARMARRLYFAGK
jgi:phosphatidylserine/phosphatidylglycerophosphate/cardiolipin synthase-like enzyme